MINLDPGEKVILEARRHWFVISKIGAFLFMVAIVPIIVFVVAAIIFPEIATTLGASKFQQLVIFLGSSWLLIVWIIFFISWTDYYLDVLVVTNKRLIDIEQIGLFRRDLATIPIGNIQDIKIEVKGLIQTLLKFGNLHVQTAGFSKELVIKEIKDPHMVKQIIMSVYHTKTEG